MGATSLEPTLATGSQTIAAGTAQTYTWPTARKEMWIMTDDACGCKLLVRFNPATPASLTKWHAQVLPGALLPGPSRSDVHSVSIYNAGASTMTLHEDFVVAGW